MEMTHRAGGTDYVMWPPPHKGPGEEEEKVTCLHVKHQAYGYDVDN